MHGRLYPHAPVGCNRPCSTDLCGDHPLLIKRGRLTGACTINSAFQNMHGNIYQQNECAHAGLSVRAPVGTVSHNLCSRAFCVLMCVYQFCSPCMHKQACVLADPLSRCNLRHVSGGGAFGRSRFGCVTVASPYIRGLNPHEDLLDRTNSWRGSLGGLLLLAHDHVFTRTGIEERWDTHYDFTCRSDHARRVHACKIK